MDRFKERLSFETDSHSVEYITNFQGSFKPSLRYASTMDEDEIRNSTTDQTNPLLAVMIADN